MRHRGRRVGCGRAARGTSATEERRGGSQEMDFDYSPNVRARIDQVEAFMEEHVYPREREHHDFVMAPENLWKQPPVVEELKAEAKKADIWNWFLPAEYGDWSPGLTNLEFAPMAEVM